MNILELIPGISGIIEKIIPDPNKQQELKLEMSKLDAQEKLRDLQIAQITKSIEQTSKAYELLRLDLQALQQTVITGKGKVTP